VAVVRLRYADLLSESRLFVEAEAEYAQAIGVLQDNGRATVDAYASTLLHLGELYERRALHLRAEAQYHTLLQLVEREALGEPLLATTLERLGHVCEVLGKLTEATVFYQRAMSVLNTTRPVPEETRRIQTKLAELTSLSSGSTP
jgi:tetratricopeptide (TPR) repeat protein